jgi:nucleoid DNA-binding protein
MTLTKDALIGEVARDNGYLRNQAVELIETLLEIIKSKLVSGEDVRSVVSGNSASRRSAREVAGIRLLVRT